MSFALDLRCEGWSHVDMSRLLLEVREWKWGTHFLGGRCLRWFHQMLCSISLSRAPIGIHYIKIFIKHFESPECKDLYICVCLARYCIFIFVITKINDPSLSTGLYPLYFFPPFPPLFNSINRILCIPSSFHLPWPDHTWSWDPKKM